MGVYTGIAGLTGFTGINTEFGRELSLQKGVSIRIILSSNY